MWTFIENLKVVNDAAGCVKLTSDFNNCTTKDEGKKNKTFLMQKPYYKTIEIDFPMQSDVQLANAF